MVEMGYTWFGLDKSESVSPEPSSAEKFPVFVMQELFDQLDGANVLLKRALNKYFEASSAVQKFYDQASPGGIPLELSNRIAKEFSSLGSFERKLKRVKAAIGRVRNHHYPAVPIHSLPPELLNRVFSLVVGARPCGVQECSGEIITFPKYPDLLAHVCSRWRQIALNQPSLWSHIDIVPYHNMSLGFYSRAKTNATRANLLDIHCYEPNFILNSDEKLVHRLFKRVGSQIRSLELVAPTSSEMFELGYILASCLEWAAPGVFNQLTVTNPGQDAPVFWRPRNHGNDDPNMDDTDGLQGLDRWLFVSPTDLDQVLLPVTVLRLDGAYFLWNHSAYHNLVELRLIASGGSGSGARLAESDLLNMLMHSPRLQALHFGLTITANFSGDVPWAPVRLEDLRTINLTPKDHGSIGLLLRLLAPGQNGLRLSIRFGRAISQVYDDNAVQFFARSNVETLHACIGHESGLGELTGRILFIDEVIRPLHRLRILALQSLVLSDDSDLASGLNGTLANSEHRLDTLYLLDCSATLALLRQLTLRHPANMIAFWRTSSYDGDVYLPSQELATRFISDNYQVISIDDQRPNPIVHWDQY